MQVLACACVDSWYFSNQEYRRIDVSLTRNSHPHNIVVYSANYIVHTHRVPLSRHHSPVYHPRSRVEQTLSNYLADITSVEVLITSPSQGRVSTESCRPTTIHPCNACSGTLQSDPQYIEKTIKIVKITNPNPKKYSLK